MKKILLVLGLAICMASCSKEWSDENPEQAPVASEAPRAEYIQLPADPMVVGGYYTLTVMNRTSSYDWEVTQCPEPNNSRCYYLQDHSQFNQNTGNNSHIKYFQANVEGWYEITVYSWSTGAPAASVGFYVSSASSASLVAPEVHRANPYLELPAHDMHVGVYDFIWCRNGDSRGYDWKVTQTPTPVAGIYQWIYHSQYNPDTLAYVNVRGFKTSVAGWYMITLYKPGTQTPVTAVGFNVYP